MLRKADVPAAGAALGVGVPPRLRTMADIRALHRPWCAAIATGLLQVGDGSVTAGPALDAVLNDLRSPEARREKAPPGLEAELRPYQKTGYGWLRHVTRLGLGACLADDMGLGKTIQVISLLLDLKRDGRKNASLLIVPASLIANWKSELAKFAPGLSFAVVHPSETGSDAGEIGPDDADSFDLIACVRRHQLDALALLQVAVDDAYEHDDAEIGVVPAVDEHRLQGL